MAYGQAIIKFVNYADKANPTRAERLSKYLQLLERTDENLITSNYIDKKDIAHGLEVIEKNFNPRGHRSFKQGIISTGVSCKELSPTEFLKFMNELLTNFFKGYPYLAAVHTNKPERLHSHFLLGMTNVLTGKKFSQSKRDLQNFKDYYDELAKQYKLPVTKIGDNPQTNFVEEAEPNEKLAEFVVERSPPIMQTGFSLYYPPPIVDLNSENCSLSRTMEGVDNSKFVKAQEENLHSDNNIGKIILNQFHQDYKTWWNIGKEWSK